MATKGILCKYHMNGVCKFGDKCLFSHDKQELPSQVCTYYLAGCCAYGDKCRYEHGKPEWFKQQQGSTPSAYTAPALPKPAVSDPSELIAQDGAPDVSAHVALRPVASSKDANAERLPFSVVLATPPTAVAVESVPLECDEEEWEEDPTAYGADGEQAYFDPSAANGNGYQAAYMGAEGTMYYPQGAGYPDPNNGDYGSCSYANGNGNGGYVTGYNGYGMNGQGYENGYEHGYEQGYEGEEGQYDVVAWPAGEGASGEALAEEGEDDWTAGPGASMTDPAELPLCSTFSAVGTCPKGDFCQLIHGNLCEICNKFALHPYNEVEASSHSRQCRARHDKLAARLRSASVECCICLERCLSAPDPRQRRFGLMSCDHAFCLHCIRGWRSTEGADVDTALRTCPVCRTSTHFITPSAVWPSSAEEKEAILSGYKRTLATKPCRNFNFGEGKCPFGTSCFYRHEYRDGRLEEPCLRKVGTADGDVRVMKPLSLASFLDTPQAQRLLQTRRRR